MYSGQRLGSIAKRYNVSIAAICKANGIKRRDPIHPGQKLVIPGTEAPDSDDDNKKSGGKAGPPRIHVVAKGHTLSAIGGRYAVTVSAICHANGIKRSHALKVGEKLVIPHKNDRDGSYARKLRLQGKLDDKLEDDSSHGKKKKSSRSKRSWAPYVKPAWRRGYIKIRRYGRSWEGYVIGPKEQVLGHASNKINYVMGTREGGPRVDPRLIRLIAHVSDKFGGRQLRIVSGYRTKSYVAASKHKEGRAIDFSIPGIPNEALRDYLRTLDDVGVGYYPNSSFVHLDVRGYNAYWVDYSGPGEPPRKRPRGSNQPSKQAKSGDRKKNESEASNRDSKEKKSPPSKSSQRGKDGKAKSDNGATGDHEKNGRAKSGSAKDGSAKDGKARNTDSRDKVAQAAEEDVTSAED